VPSLGKGIQPAAVLGSERAPHDLLVLLGHRPLSITPWTTAFHACRYFSNATLASEPLIAWLCSAGPCSWSSKGCRASTCRTRLRCRGIRRIVRCGWRPRFGARQASGADLFYFSAATPTGARRTRGILIVDRFSWEAVEETLRELIADAPSGTWEDATRYLNTHLVWEFDGE
jgi:hypothetical protein